MLDALTGRKLLLFSGLTKKKKEKRIEKRDGVHPESELFSLSPPVVSGTFTVQYNLACAYTDKTNCFVSDCRFCLLVCRW